MEQPAAEVRGSAALDASTTLALVLARPVVRLLPTRCSRTISQQKTEPLPYAANYTAKPAVAAMVNEMLKQT